MAEFHRSRPNQELSKLRKWGPGRHAQLRLFIGHLESAFHTSLAAQVRQSSKRKFSEFVPKIVTQDITTEVEYREIRMVWEPPRGLRDFLYYELAVSLFENFAQFDSFVTSDPFFVFPNLLDGRTYYIRIRVVTKNGFFGPWSDTISADTPFSQSFGLFDGSEYTVPVFASGTFDTVFVRTYNAIGGKAYYSIDYELTVQVVGDATSNVEWTDVEFQWMIDSAQMGQNFLVTSYGTNATTALGSNLEAITADIGSFPSDHLTLSGPFTLSRRGTFIQKFSELTAGSHTIEIRARVVNGHPLRNDWEFNPTASDVMYGQGAVLKLKNFNIFEALVS